MSTGLRRLLRRPLQNRVRTGGPNRSLPSALLVALLAGAPLPAEPSRAQVPDRPRPGGVVEEFTSRPVPDLEPVLGPVARRIPRIMERDGVPGLVVLVLRDATPVASAAFGFASPSARRPMTIDAVFRVESISKPVTAWGVLRLIETGLLGLDDPVSDHLVRWSPPPTTPPLTVAHLLSQTGGIGLGDYTARFSPDGPVPSLVTSLKDEFRQVAAPGTGFRYSDTGFNLLQLVVEDVMGRPFADVMEEEVLAPLDMDGATYRWSPGLATRMPVGHTLRGDPVAPYVYPGVASGGLLATAEAVARFARAGLSGAGESLHRPRVEVGGLYGVVADGYGLGHFAETLSDGRRAVWHGGQGYGWMSHLHLVPVSGDGIVLLANTQRAWPLFAEVLRGWSGVLGVEPVKMARITWARTLALGVVALLVLAAGVVGWRWVRRAPGRAPGRLSVVLRGGIGAAFLVAVAWCATREYLFLFSVLPGTSGWLGAAAGLLGGVLVLSAFPAPGGYGISLCTS